jgi:hypothetical protein
MLKLTGKDVAMNQEKIIAAAIRDELRERPYSLPEDYAGSVITALEEEGYSIHKDDPSMVYVPREPTEAQAKAAAAEVPLANVSVFGWMAGYRAMISAVTKE